MPRATVATRTTPTAAPSRPALTPSVTIERLHRDIHTARVTDDGGVSDQVERDRDPADP